MGKAGSLAARSGTATRRRSITDAVASRARSSTPGRSGQAAPVPEVIAERRLASRAERETPLLLAVAAEGKSLAAGKYSLYTVPGETEWVFIFNSQTGQSGVKANEETSEDPAKDVLRVTVKPEKSASFNERMKFEVEKSGFSLLWENLKVPVSVR